MAREKDPREVLSEYRTSKLLRVLKSKLHYRTMRIVTDSTIFDGIPVDKTYEMLNRIMTYRELFGIHHANVFFEPRKTGSVHITWHQFEPGTLVRIGNELQFNHVGHQYWLSGGPLSVDIDDGKFCQFVSLDHVSLHPLTFMRTASRV